MFPGDAVAHHRPSWNSSAGKARADMYISPKASPARQREAHEPLENRAEIVEAHSHGRITRRDFCKRAIHTDHFANTSDPKSNVMSGPPGEIFARVSRRNGTTFNRIALMRTTGSNG